MKRLYPTVVLAGMLALSLSACSSMGGADASGSGTSGATDSGNGSASLGATGDPVPPAGIMPANGIESDAAAGQSGSLGASGASGATGSSAQDTQRSASPTAASTTPNSTVISIEPLASSSTGSSASGTSGTGSTSGSTAGAEQAYRITLRMDDGSTQVVSQATTPTYRSGDRVNLSSGVILR